MTFQLYFRSNLTTFQKKFFYIEKISPFPTAIYRCVLKRDGFQFKDFSVRLLPPSAWIVILRLFA